MVGINTLHRDLDEKAAVQRQREAEAEAKLAAKRAGTRIPDRTAPPVRVESSEMPTGPPILALAGNKPTWRERQAQKVAEGAAVAPAASTSSPAPAVADTTVPAVEPLKRSGYVPPQKRGDVSRGRTDNEPPATDRNESSGGDRWRPRPRDEGRDGSPADAAPARVIRRDGPNARDESTDASKYVPRFRQDAGARSEAPPARTESPANPAAKYVPRHLRDRQ